MLKNTENNYGLVARVFHWLVGVIIIIMLIIGFIMADMENSEQKWQIYNMHKATGMVVLFLALFRLIWRIMNSKVLLPDDLPNWQKKASYMAHMLLYGLMFAMPISGFLMSTLGGYDINIYGLFTIKAFAKQEQYAKLFWALHGYGAFLFVCVIALHFMAAMYHHFIRKDNVLVRMIKS